MASPAPTVGYLSSFRNSPQYKDTVAMFEPFIKAQDWSTRELSLSHIKRMAGKREELFQKMNVMMRDPSKTADDSYRVRRTAEIVEKMVHALQKWHFDRFGSSPTV